MFTDNTTWGVILAILFICGALASVLYFTRSLIAQEKILFLLIFLVVGQFSVWLIDRVVAFRIQLLREEESRFIMTTIDSIVKLVLGYYLGTKATEKDNDKI